MCHFNIAPSVDDLESPFYLAHGINIGRLSNLQNYCRCVGDQPDRLTVQELRKMWKLPAKLLAENKSTEPADHRKVTKASELQIGQIVFVKDQKGTFDLSYIFDHRVAGILNDNMVVLTTPDEKERKCNIHHIKPVTALEASTSKFSKFQDSIQNTSEKELLMKQISYNHPLLNYKL